MGQTPTRTTYRPTDLPDGPDLPDLPDFPDLYEAAATVGWSGAARRPRGNSMPSVLIL